MDQNILYTPDYSSHGNEMKLLIYHWGLAIADCVDKPEIVNPGVFEKILRIVKPAKWVS